jgi:hypothetical protein
MRQPRWRAQRSMTGDRKPPLPICQATLFGTLVNVGLRLHAEHDRRVRRDFWRPWCLMNSIRTGVASGTTRAGAEPVDPVVRIPISAARRGRWLMENAWQQHGHGSHPPFCRTSILLKQSLGRLVTAKPTELTSRHPAANRTRCHWPYPRGEIGHPSLRSGIAAPCNSSPMPAAHARCHW